MHVDTAYGSYVHKHAVSVCQDPVSKVLDKLCFEELTATGPGSGGSKATLGVLLVLLRRRLDPLLNDPAGKV